MACSLAASAVDDQADDEPANAAAVPMALRCARVAATATALAILLVPWAVLLGCEEAARLLTRSGEYRARRLGWRQLTWMYDDVAWLATRCTGAYSAMRWSWPDARTGSRVVLTFDDAPGDNEESLCELLGLLEEYGARATFFCTTSLIAGREGLMRRIVAAGHELCNHMPHDRSYALLGEPAFAADLRAAEEALAPFQPQLPPPSARTWFRPPMGAMSCAMARVLQREGYSPLLGDVFSNDVFVGGGRRGTQAGAATVAWHVEYCARRTKPGSVVIFHVPRARDRLSVVPITRGFLEWCESRGLSCVTASELAASHVGANNVLP